MIQLDDLDEFQVNQIAPHAFIVIRSSPGNYQAWVALSDAPADFARRLRKGTGADPSASGATRIAGSINFKPKYAPHFPLVEITQVCANKVISVTELEACGLVARPDNPLPATPRSGPKRWPSYEKCIAGAPPVHKGDRADISKADFTWCMTAIGWGWGVEETAERLMGLSSKAQRNGERYALTTVKNAATAVSEGVHTQGNAGR
jgi:hypothetical protein